MQYFIVVFKLKIINFNFILLLILQNKQSIVNSVPLKNSLK